MSMQPGLCCKSTVPRGTENLISGGGGQHYNSEFLSSSSHFLPCVGRRKQEQERAGRGVLHVAAFVIDREAKMSFENCSRQHCNTWCKIFLDEDVCIVADGSGNGSGGLPYHGSANRLAQLAYIITSIHRYQKA